MAYNAELLFNGAGKYKVLDVNYNVARTNDPSGRVASDPSNATIKLKVEATEKSEILESMLNGKFKPTTGKITFNKAHEEGKLIECSWKNGYVIWHEVDFDAVDAKSMTINFVVSAEQITYGNAEYDGKWPNQ